MRRSKTFLFSIIFWSIPPLACASSGVSITELMYDLPGSDTGREWIELTNQGTSAIDLSQYKLVEGTTNHTLILLSDSSSLSSLESAVIVEDQSKFMADNPSYSGILFKASFSLSNTGETLQIKDKTGEVIDEITYDSNMGAEGDGNTLNLQGLNLVVASPSPGTYSQTGTLQSNTISNTSTDSTPPPSETQSSKGGAPAPKMEIDMGEDRVVEVGAGTVYEAHIYNSNGLPLSANRYSWNFGDGNVREGQSVFYAYRYPGVYAVILTIDAGNDYATSGKITVTAVPAEVSLAEDSDGSLTISNVTHSKRDMDISFWILARGGKIFTIPKGTILLAGQAVRFSPDLLKLSEGEPVLEYPSGEIAAQINHSVGTQSGMTYIKDAQVTAAPVSIVHAPSQSNIQGTSSPLVAAAADSGVSIPIQYPLAGLGALLLLGIAGTMYARHGSTTRRLTDETDRLAEEFDITEG